MSEIDKQLGLRPAMFIGYAVGIDFLNSVSYPAGGEIDWLADGEGLLTWLVQAGLVPADVVAEMRTHSFSGELDAVAEQARALREWFRQFVLRNKGEKNIASALSQLHPLNDILSRDECYGMLFPINDSERMREHGFRCTSQAGSLSLNLRLRRRWRGAGSLLLPIALELARLAAEADFSLIKSCEGPTCTLLFLDTTKSHSRRWCNMATCGNRVKQAAHRARTKETP